MLTVIRYFRGMGDSGRNMDAVGQAVEALADRDRMSMAQSKITISTVGPSPEAFEVLAKMPGECRGGSRVACNSINY